MDDIRILKLRNHARTLINDILTTRQYHCETMEKLEHVYIQHKALLKEYSMLVDEKQRLENYTVDGMVHEAVDIGTKPRLLNELSERIQMMQKIDVLEKIRLQKLENMQKDRHEWNVFKQNFRGLCQSGHIFMSRLGTSLDKLRSEIERNM